MCYSSECYLQVLSPWGKHVSVSAILDHGLREMCFCFKSKHVYGTCCWWILFFVVEFARCSTTKNKAPGQVMVLGIGFGKMFLFQNVDEMLNFVTQFNLCQ